MRLEDIHAGRIAAILGGGPSLKEDLQSVPEGSVFFAVNHYASQAGIVCDYTVYNDRHTVQWIKRDGAKLVSKWADDADIYVPFEDGTLSCLLAARLARHMGCAPIILCGFDCTGTHKSQPVDVEWYLRRWRNENPENVLAASGPLVALFGSVQEAVQPKPQKITIDIFEAKTVALNERQTVNFVPGVQTLPRRQAEAAIAAGIAIKEK